jgi:muramidase (phage lysozyme)
MCFFTTLATTFGFSLFCDFKDKPDELSILIPMFMMGMISNAAGPYFLMEQDFDVRILLISFSNL